MRWPPRALLELLPHSMSSIRRHPAKQDALRRRPRQPAQIACPGHPIRACSDQVRHPLLCEFPLPSASISIVSPVFWSFAQAPMTNASFTETCDRFDTLRLKFACILHEARDMLGRTGRGKLPARAYYLAARNSHPLTGPSAHFVERGGRHLICLRSS